jgi:hypothetical protein
MKISKCIDTEDLCEWPWAVLYLFAFNSNIDADAYLLKLL